LSIYVPNGKRPSSWNKHTKPRAGRLNTKNRNNPKWKQNPNKRRKKITGSHLMNNILNKYALELDKKNINSIKVCSEELREKGEFDAVFDILSIGAGLEDSYCIWALGEAYYYGEGVAQSIELALQHYKKSAEMGLALGMTSYAFCLHEENQVLNASEIVKWYEQAVDLGEVNAMHNLGLCYLNGEGVAKDSAKAYELFFKAADGGHPEAAFKIGWSYLNGEVLPKSTSEGRRWMKRAKALGYEAD
jgi:TPR repeat protein